MMNFFLKTWRASSPSPRRLPVAMIYSTVKATAKLCFHQRRSSIAISESIPTAARLIEMSTTRS